MPKENKIVIIEIAISNSIKVKPVLKRKEEDLEDNFFEQNFFMHLGIGRFVVTTYTSSTSITAPTPAHTSTANF